jgi:hypothetical protein
MYLLVLWLTKTNHPDSQLAEGSTMPTLLQWEHMKAATISNHLLCVYLVNGHITRARAHLTNGPAYSTLCNHFSVLHSELEALKVRFARMWSLSPLEDSTFGYHCMLCKIAVEITWGVYHAGEFVDSLLASQA